MATGGCRNELTDSRERVTVLLINALLLPGLGHIYIRRFVSGISIAVAFTSVTLIIIVKFAFALYLFVIAKGWQAGLGGTLTFFVSLWEDTLVRQSILFAAGLWVVSVADSFRITRKK